MGKGLNVAPDALFEDLQDLFVRLEEILIAALLVEIDAPHALHDGVHGAVVRVGIDVPALERAAVEGVRVLDVLLEGVPVEFAAELLFEKLDRVVDLVHAELPRRRVVVHERHRERVHGLLAVVGDRAPHGVVVHHVRVAGRVRREPAVAEVGIFVLDGDAGLQQRERAHLARDAAGDGLIDVVAAELLAEQRHHERAVLRDVHGLDAGKAVDDVLRERIVKGDGRVRPLRLAEIAVGAEHLPEGVHRIGHHALHGGGVRPQGHAAVAVEPAVDHHRRAEIGREPAIFPERLRHPDGIARDEPRHRDPELCPVDKGVGRVAHAAPFAPGVEVRALDEALPEIVARLIAPEEMPERAVLLFDADLPFPHGLIPPSECA